jgi:protein tyrosine/serine phosphatase
VTETLYRSGQPSAEGFARLAELGIKTVVNLRSSDSDRDKLAGLDLDYERVPMHFYHLERSDLAEFLAVAGDSSRAPVLVHCKHGADRTGAAVASYRVLVEGWSREEAVAEMSHGGFGFHKILWNMAEWILKLDMEQLAAEAGLDASGSPAG